MESLPGYNYLDSQAAQYMPFYVT